MKISSTSNPKIKELLDIRRRKNRKGDSRFIIEGEHIVEMALKAGIFFHEIFFTELFERKEEGRKILEQLSLKEVKAYKITDHVLRRVSDTETPQGILAVVLPGIISIEELKLPENPLIVLADGIGEPGNLGAVIRTADAAGVHAVVILPGTCDLFNQKTIRATAGSLFNIPIIHSDVDKLLDWLRRHKICLATTAARGGTPVFDADLDKAVAFAFGNEAHGIRKELKAAAGINLQIPIYGKAESLNVVVAAAIILYETARQRRLVNSGKN